MPDVLIRAGTYNFMPPLPAVPGQELSGTIEKVGAGVTTRRVGQRVYTSARERPHRGGHYAEFVATPADATFLLPDTVTFDTAATLAAALIERNRIQRAEYERRAAQSSLGIAPFRTTWPVGTVLEAEWVTEHLGVSPSKHRGGGPMKPRRRQFLHLVAGVAVLPAISRFARAQTYPTRPVRLIIGYPPGGSADMTARLMGQWLSERLGQTFVIESRPGAATNIATEAVVHAPPDGYTLLLVAPANAINVTLYEKLNYNFLHDIAPVAGLIRFPNVMEVNPSVPAKTVPEFIAYAKANPGKLNMASSGNGSTIHVSGELFKMMTGISMIHVPYRGGAPALTDMISGQVQVMFDNVPTSIEFIRAGKLRPLAVTTAQRSEVLPDLPTVADFVPGYEASAWYGVGAPKGTPAEIIDKLNSEINAILANPKTKSRFAELGASLIGGLPADFGKLVVEETDKWGKVVRFSGAKPD
jgi:tripartite-type tricarboxylate transporter receptor subunit TctC